MAKTFAELKAARKQNFDMIRSTTKFDHGTHRSTKLKRAGCLKSGSLLHKDVAIRHARHLEAEYKARLGKVGKQAKNRFRFLTILHEVCSTDIRDVKASVKSFEAMFLDVFKKTRIWTVGAIELELVNVNLLESISSGRDDEKRKLRVIRGLRKKVDFGGLLLEDTISQTEVLVHCHVLVDLGEDADQNEELLKTALSKKSFWKRVGWQIDLKSLFESKPVSSSLKDIAKYLVKGGNEDLRFKAGFERELSSDLDAKMKSGSGRKDQYGEKIDIKTGVIIDTRGESLEDERGLSIHEVKILDELYCWLARRRRDRLGYRGYLIKHYE